MADDWRRARGKMDRFEPLTSTVNAIFELMTVKTVNTTRKCMILQGDDVNRER